jgi:hypothetical protein
MHEPTVKGALVYYEYTYQNTTYRHRYDFGMTIAADDPTVRRLLNWLGVVSAFYLFSIEYFTELAAEFPLDADEQDFFQKLTYNGMAEFRQVNGIAMDTATKVTPTATETLDVSGESPALSGALLLNGGGKDGCVSALLLEQTGHPFDWFMLNSSVAQDRVAEASGKHVVKVKRQMDDRRFDGKYTGHRPTSACIAICSVLAAYLTGRASVIASNEQSANEGNGTIDGVQVNHQYSKSLEFERDYGQLLRSHHIPVQYFSLLRPLHELQIVKVMTHSDQYLRTFTSCNHGYKRGEWCMQCAKCAFIVLVFTALDPASAKIVWNDELAINTPAFLPFIQELIDPAVQKPLECVGTIEECQLAARLILTGPLHDRLSPELHTMLEAHASASTDTAAFLQTLSDQHAVPVEYQDIFANLDQQLA